MSCRMRDSGDNALALKSLKGKIIDLIVHSTNQCGWTMEYRTVLEKKIQPYIT